MTHNEYLIYCEMQKEIPNKIEQIKQELKSKDCIIISDIFVAVGKEETRQYFVDCEYLNSYGEYHRIYGLKKL